MAHELLARAGTLSGIAAGALLVTFIGICLWAYSGRRRRAFDAVAQLPLEDDDLHPVARPGKPAQGGKQAAERDKKP